MHISYPNLNRFRLIGIRINRNQANFWVIESYPTYVQLLPGRVPDGKLSRRVAVLPAALVLPFKLTPFSWLLLSKKMGYPVYDPLLTLKVWLVRG